MLGVVGANCSVSWLTTVVGKVTINMQVARNMLVLVSHSIYSSLSFFLFSLRGVAFCYWDSLLFHSNRIIEWGKKFNL